MVSARGAAEGSVPVAAPAVAALARRLTGGRRLLVVSSRGPYAGPGAGGRSDVPKEGFDEVAVTLSNLARYTPATWVAGAGAARTGLRRHGTNGRRRRDLRLRPVLPGRGGSDRFANVICDPVLWLLQHGQWGLLGRDRTMAEIVRAWERGYLGVNRAFARRVLSELADEDTAPIVMFHGYQLCAAPPHVRAGAEGAVLSYFIHIPWPATDVWQQLPWPVTLSIVGGLLACDLVGFQTAQSAHNFLLTCNDFIGGAAVDFQARTVTVDGHTTTVRAYPVSADLVSLRERMASPAVRLRKTALAADAPPRTIVRVGRLDPVANVLAGLQAFDLLLERDPSLARRVQFLAFLAPSSRAVPEYRSHADAVFAAVREINQRWGGDGRQPVRLSCEDNYARALAGLALYDVLLDNPLSDGMSLASKEGAIVNERDGVLVLSRPAGAFPELGHAALTVDPGDVAGTADALAAALAMPADERARRAAALRRSVEAKDFSLWLERRLSDLQTVAAARRPGAGTNGRRAGNGRRRP